MVNGFFNVTSFSAHLTMVNAICFHPNAVANATD